MIPAELHAYVVARWQEKLDTVRAATPGPWSVYRWRRFHLTRQRHRDQPVYVWVMPSTGKSGVIAERHIGGTVEDMEHIAAFNPAFAIAVCEAALRRLGRHIPDLHTETTATSWDDSRSHLPTDGPYWICETCSLDESWRKTRWPCPEVLDDAAPFADRSDFPKELRA